MSDEISPSFRRARMALGGLLLSGLAAGALLAEPPVPGNAPGLDVERFVGPDACSECHVEEFETWRASAHQKESTMLTRSPEARAIAQALGIRRIKNDARCTSCHFTVMGESAEHANAVSGVSCESCHGPARDWLALHDDFGGADVTAGAETDAHRTERETRCDEQGMIRPAETHAIAEQCFTCHTIADEELVAAGHPTGAGFELVAWSQGEMRHNFVRAEGAGNAIASQEHQRVLYVVGQMLELEHAVRALAGASPQSGDGPSPFVEATTARARDAIEKLERIASEASLMEADVVLDAVRATELAPGMDPAPIGEAVETCALKLEMRAAAGDLDLSVLDSLLPNEFVGKPAR